MEAVTVTDFALLLESSDEGLVAFSCASVVKSNDTFLERPMPVIASWSGKGVVGSNIRNLSKNPNLTLISVDTRPNFLPANDLY